MQQAISLLALNQLIKETLEIQLEPAYWVIAEIAELNQGRQGHAYLDLVEKQGNQIVAKIRANIWAYTFRGIASKFKSITGQDLKTGMKVLAQVNVTFHEIYGISLNIKDIDPNFTLGERARIRQEIIDKLSSEGMMELNRRLDLPEVPQKIAVISSATAAGYGDFINQIDNNRFGYRIHHKLYQATLQGIDAPATIMRAFDEVIVDHNKKAFDAVVLIRGGGSQLDLDCFDDYQLAVTIASCPIPVITGIGHERDETIADLVAHTKMKTPTATAEFLLSGFHAFEEKIKGLMKILERNASQIWSWEEKTLRELERRLHQQSKFTLNQASENLSFKTKQIRSLASQQISIKSLNLNNLNQNLKKASKRIIQKSEDTIRQLEKDIVRMDPNTFFDKGYTRSEINGVPVHLTSIKSGDKMITFSQKNIIESTITTIENKNLDI